MVSWHLKGLGDEEENVLAGQEHHISLAGVGRLPREKIRMGGDLILYECIFDIEAVGVG